MFFGFTTTGPILLIIPSFILFGLAWGIGNGIATPIALSQLPNSEDAGVVSGAITTILNIFAVLSLTTASAVFRVSKTYIYTKQIGAITDERAISILSSKSISDASKAILTLYPQKIANNIIQLYKSSFLFGMNSAYGLILLATIICWIISNKLIKSNFRPQ